MTIIEPTFKDVKCNDCGNLAPEAELVSFNSFTPIPKEYSLDGNCPKCGSENTQIVPFFDFGNKLTK